MKISRKTMAAIIALVLTLTITGTFILPTVTAHDPAWTIHTWVYIDAAPDPVGVGQTALLVFWSDYYPATASGEYGDRFTYNIEVTKPDGSKENLGPIVSDPVGGGWTTYTPTQVGTYSFVAHMDEVVYGTTGIYPTTEPKEDFVRAVWFGDIQEAATSEPCPLVVQNEQIAQYPTAELPTGYWDRPIYSTNREWAKLGSSWLADTNDKPTCTAPKTGHIIWTRPATFGGIVGEPYGTISYHTGSAYEAFSNGQIANGRLSMMVVNGRLYYNEPKAPRYGWYSVDLRTGEEIFWQNSTGPIQVGSQTGAHIGNTNIPWLYPPISFAQIFNFDSGNQHGARAYIISQFRQTEDETFSYERLNGSIYSFDVARNAYVYGINDAFTGNWICNIANVPSGSITRGPNGEILKYRLNDLELRIWNSTVAMGWPNNNLGVEFGLPGGGGSSEAYYWMWREPIGQTVDGNNGYNEITYTFDTPSAGDPGIFRVGNEIMLCTDEIGDTLYLYGYSMKPGEVGKLLWQKELAIPYPLSASTSRNRWRMGPVSEDEGVFCLNMKEDLQWYAFDLNTGNQIWGPSEKQGVFDLYGMGGQIYEGKLISAGYGGKIYAYDLTDGHRLWTYSTGSTGLESAWPDWPLRGSLIIADGKIYATTDEHSHTQPLYRGWGLHCVDTNTGEALWVSNGLYAYGALGIADGYVVGFNSMDNQYYVFGKGQTDITIEAPLTAVPKGTSVVIRGMVTDQSPGAKDTPAIADTDMTEWMAYTYQQGPLPMDATGVPVTIDAIDPNGNYINIGHTTSDMSGFYSIMWKPENEGKYTVITTFEGSDSYYASYAETALGVGPAASAGGPIEPEQPTEVPFITTEVAIILAIVVAIIVGIAGFWALRKRK